MTEIHMNLVENKQENETESRTRKNRYVCVKRLFADLEEPEEKQKK